MQQKQAKEKEKGEKKRVRKEKMTEKKKESRTEEASSSVTIDMEGGQCAFCHSVVPPDSDVEVDE